MGAVTPPSPDDLGDFNPPNTPTPQTERLPADIWVLVAAAFIVALGYGIIAPVLPQFATSFNVGETAAAVVVSAFAFFRLVFAPGGGALVNRLGERAVYITGLVIVSASTYAVAFAGSYWQLLLFRGLGGLGSTMFTVSAMALIVKLAPRGARARATGLYATSFLVGNIAGPVAGGLMAGWGLRMPFIIYGTGLLIAAAVVYFKLASPPPAAGQATAGQELAAAPMRFREAWAHHAYKTALVGAFVAGWSAMGIRVAIYPLFALSVLSAGPGEAGLALTFFAVGNALAITVSSRLADKYGRMPFTRAGFAVMGVATILLGVWPDLVVFWVLSAVAGLGAGLLTPAQQATVADVVGSDRPAGVVLSRFQMAMDFGSIVGPIATAAVSQHFSYALAFGVAGVFALVAAALWVFTPEPRRAM